jgi:hypothetical protein
MVVSLTALVVATSGTAVAATTLVNGDKLIRKDSLSGDRLRKHSLTGTQINLSKLGQVPKAGAADTAGSAGYAAHAGSADTATNATNAVNATHAGNSAALGGQPASSYLTTGSRVGTNGIVSEAGTSSWTTVTLFTSGPFTVTMNCRTVGADSEAILYVSSAEAGADFGYGTQSNDYVNSDVAADTTYKLGDIGPSPIGESDNPLSLALEAPSGAQVVATGAIGVNDVSGPGTCWANFAGIA